MSVSPPRRLVLFLDGTWNKDDGTHPLTNIVRLREALKLGVEARENRDPLQGKSSFGQGTVASAGADEFEYIVHYDSGVGTGPFDRWTGGVTGAGLEENIREAYRFLSAHFRSGDEIHIVGFSRGAYTARSVVGYLFATGLLKPEHCTKEREAQAWSHYRTSPGERNCGDWYALKPYLHPSDQVIVRSLGVFDTVGSLGIPTTPLRLYNQIKSAFHNTDLSSIVKYSFHAVAIDKHRNAFEATLWHTPKFKKFPDARVEQVWFPGAHADVGGGYHAWNHREGGRQDIAFAWMLGRLRDLAGLPFGTLHPDSAAPALACAPEAQVEASIHRPWSRLDRVRKQACRAINQTEPIASEGIPVPGRGVRVVGLRPNEEPIGEMIHISALVLLRPRQAVRWEGLDAPHPYRPPNLIAALPLIAYTYRNWNPLAWQGWRNHADAIPRMSERPRTLSVVDWSGAPIPRQPPADGVGNTAEDVFRYLGSDPSAFGFRPSA